MKETRIGNIAISDRDNSMGNVNKLPDAMILLKDVIWNFIMLQGCSLYKIRF